MGKYEFVHFEKIDLRNHPDFNEKWVQERIAENPEILGLGEVVLKDKERRQPGAGRLDLLLQDPDATRRYEVEIQLGRTDESHIIRTIEYWDIERKRYPQYEHTAVLVAEDITSRFLNVVSLFNGSIPVMAIQMNAFSWENRVSLAFTTVLDTVAPGLDEEDEVQEVVDRSYWENKRGTKATVAMADRLLKLIQTFAPDFELKYNKFYIGLAREGQARNFAVFRPQKKAMRLEVRGKKTEDLERSFEEAGLDLMDYDTRWRRYRLQLKKGDIDKNEAFLRDLLKKAFDESVAS